MENIWEIYRNIMGISQIKGIFYIYIHGNITNIWDILYIYIHGNITNIWDILYIYILYIYILYIYIHIMIVDCDRSTFPTKKSTRAASNAHKQDGIIPHDIPSKTTMCLVEIHRFAYGIPIKSGGSKPL